MTMTNVDARSRLANRRTLSYLLVSLATLAFASPLFYLGFGEARGFLQRAQVGSAELFAALITAVVFGGLALLVARNLGAIVVMKRKRQWVDELVAEGASRADLETVISHW